MIFTVIMPLPNSQHAIVELAKLRDYCLSSRHKEGKFKARVFFSALSITDADAPLLREWLMAAATNSDGLVSGQDSYGTRYVIDFSISHNNRSARIRSAWIIRNDEDFPRLVTCYVL